MLKNERLRGRIKEYKIKSIKRGMNDGTLPLLLIPR
jgi:hypothetical protein